MRIAAGVLLIIAAVFNLFGSFVYLGGGAAASAGSEYSTELQAQLDTNNAEMTAEEKAAFAQASEVMAGGGVTWMAMGVFMLVSVGILIAGAVFLFMSQKPTFILIAGAMALLAEVFGILLISFGVMNIIGLVAGVLAIVCANTMRKALNPV